MAITVEQQRRATNGTAQTFNVIYSPAPTENNLLVAVLGHDEVGEDISDITSSGWIRMNTFDAAAVAPDLRLSVWAKFAGAAESTTVAFDLGEVNRRAHGRAIEVSGHLFTALQPEDTADQTTGEDGSSVSSNQVDSALVIPANLIGIIHVFMLGNITDPSVSWDSGVTLIDDWSNNFRGSALGYLEGADTQQPTASWTTATPVGHQFVVIGEGAAPVPESTLLRGSNFQVRPASQ